MNEQTTMKRPRRTKFLMGGFVLLALVLLVSSAFASQVQGVPNTAGKATLAGPTGLASVDHAGRVVPAAIAAATVFVNRSQTAGTYQKEYVVLNNSTTLTALPYTSTSFHGCTWFTVVNTTQAPAALQPFHAVRYASVTTANASGTVLKGQKLTSFDVCAGNAYWVNYVYWTYSIYDFTAAVLGVNSTLAVTVGKYPGTPAAYPGNFSVKIGPKTVGVITIASNLSFNVTVTTPVNGSTTCTASS